MWSIIELYWICKLLYMARQMKVPQGILRPLSKLQNGCSFLTDSVLTRAQYALLITALRFSLRAVSIWLRPIETARLSKRESQIISKWQSSIISKGQFWHLRLQDSAYPIRLPAACHSRMRMTTCREPNWFTRRCKLLSKRESSSYRLWQS